ncbi:hypothetical protein NIES4075_41890 [Tolypothrix sp. NIES-4075]|uniref:AAA family ATPase n=1 Tax=Tolypothrix sp. NIES-4075 TaxID=2005459 RepID=UPI000B5CED55|nr:AAA family ATPase [Tolypothrix sp. NIES-4075]GAX43177.1 hypothetical protein NIES4075_41890 [Tolypothrix sp. NIES-4075]
MVKKYVLTGGPGAGKTSLLIYLEMLGELTIREASEDLIRYQHALGVAPRLDPNFEEKVLKLQLSRERNISPTWHRVFLDRGLLDVLGYYQFLNINPSELMQSVIQRLQQEKVYEKIFLIEHQRVIETTSIRIENIEQALYIEKLQAENYKQFGYEVIRIPFDSVKVRTEMILSNL